MANTRQLADCSERSDASEGPRQNSYVKRLRTDPPYSALRMTHLRGPLDEFDLDIRLAPVRMLTAVDPDLPPETALGCETNIGCNSTDGCTDGCPGPAPSDDNALVRADRPPATCATCRTDCRC